MKPRFSSLSGPVFVLALVLAPATARADLPPPPSISSCESAAADAPCQLDSGESGRCAPAKCSKLDYSQGSPPKSVEYDCLRCEQKAAADQASAAPATGSPTQPSQEPPQVQSRCAVDPAVGVLGVLAAFAGLRRRRRGQ